MVSEQSSKVRRALRRSTRDRSCGRRFGIGELPGVVKDGVARLRGVNAVTYLFCALTAVGRRITSLSFASSPFALAAAVRIYTSYKF